MKTYIIKSFHLVEKDNFNAGLGECINSYDMSVEISANNTREAIEKYFSDHLFYDFDFDQLHNEFDRLHYSVMVNVENEQASDQSIEAWKNDKIELFVNSISIEVFQLTKLLF